MTFDFDKIEDFYKNEKGGFDLENFTHYAKGCVFAHIILKPYLTQYPTNKHIYFKNIEKLVGPYLEDKISKLCMVMLPGSGYCCDYMHETDYRKKWEETQITFQTKPSLWRRFLNFFTV